MEPEQHKLNLHFFAASSNVLSGLIIIYICQFFPNGENYMLMMLIFIVFFGLYMYRLGLILGNIVSFIYILSFQIYITYFIDLDPAQYVMLTYLAWLTEGFSIVAGYISEQNDRKLFIQRRTIHDQNIIISKEKKKSENLLLNILPEHIAIRLKTKKETIADLHTNTTVLFADIVGFTDLSTRVSAKELVKILNRVFSHFDMLTEKYSLIQFCYFLYLAGIVCRIPTFVFLCSRANAISLNIPMNIKVKSIRIDIKKEKLSANELSLKYPRSVF